MLSPGDLSFSVIPKSNDFDKKCSIGHALKHPKNIKMSEVVCTSIRRVFDQILAFAPERCHLPSLARHSHEAPVLRSSLSERSGDPVCGATEDGKAAACPDPKVIYLFMPVPLS
jgi:hypothetical protein